MFITLKPDNSITNKFLAEITEASEDAFPPSAYGRISESDLEKITGFIPENAKISEFIPEIFKSQEFATKKDWNFNTIADTCNKFDILRRKHPKIDAKTFWKAVVRGGIQAAVYISDTTELKDKQ